MTPAKFDIVVYRGARVSYQFQITDVATNEPRDLTGLSPFVAQVRSKAGGPLLLDFTVADTDLTNGTITMSATPEATSNLAINDQSRWGIMDSVGNYYITGACPVENAIPEL